MVREAAVSEFSGSELNSASKREEECWGMYCIKKESAAGEVYYYHSLYKDNEYSFDHKYF